eukprot:gene12852-27094_t
MIPTFHALLFIVTVTILICTTSGGIRGSDKHKALYFEIVYGTKNLSSIRGHPVQIIYDFTRYDVKILDINISLNARNHMKQFYTLTNDLDYKFYSDYTWAEVSRRSTRCTAKLRGVPIPHFEGYSLGFPVPEYTGPMLPYGCWFYRFSGSGIFVNVGKTLTGSSRADLFKKLNVSHTNEFQDRLWCSRALELGYDSLQVNFNGKVFLPHPELIICTGKCATVTYDSACPPGVELRTGIKATIPCHCNDSYMLLNCNNHIASPVSACGDENILNGLKSGRPKLHFQLNSKKHIQSEI